MSGIFFVNIHTGAREEVLNALKDIPLVLADMNGKNIFEFIPPEKFCLCIGNEGNGLSEEVKKASDYVVSIPMQPTCESLNAGVSAGIAMYILKRNNLK
jgi:TrmH family RNA methyltransferase